MAGMSQTPNHWKTILPARKQGYAAAATIAEDSIHDVRGRSGAPNEWMHTKPHTT